MNCSNCGSPQQEGSKFCNSCGHALHQEESGVVEAAPASETSLNPTSNYAQATVTPRVYPPEHGLSWSLFLTPIAGSIFWSRNWKRLGKKQNIWWTWVTGILVMILALGSSTQNIGDLLCLIWTFVLYTIQRRMIPREIKSKQNLVVFSIFAGLSALALIISFVTGNTQTTDDKNFSMNTQVLDPNIQMDSTPNITASQTEYLGLTNSPQLISYYSGNNNNTPSYYIENITDPNHSGLFVQLKGLSSDGSTSALTWTGTIVLQNQSDNSVLDTASQSLAKPSLTHESYTILPSNLKVGEEFQYTNNSTGTIYKSIILGTGKIQLSGQTLQGLVVNQEVIDTTSNSTEYNTLSTMIYVPGIGLAEQYTALSGQDKSPYRVFAYANTNQAIYPQNFSGYIPLDPNSLTTN